MPVDIPVRIDRAEGQCYNNESIPAGKVPYQNRRHAASTNMHTALALFQAKRHWIVLFSMMEYLDRFQPLLVLNKINLMLSSGSFIPLTLENAFCPIPCRNIRQRPCIRHREQFSDYRFRFSPFLYLSNRTMTKQAPSLRSQNSNPLGLLSVTSRTSTSTETISLLRNIKLSPD